MIIGNTEYIDSGLAQLTAPGKDTEDFARVLQDKSICDFDKVRILPRSRRVGDPAVKQAIETNQAIRRSDIVPIWIDRLGARRGIIYSVIS